MGRRRNSQETPRDTSPEEQQIGDVYVALTHITYNHVSFLAGDDLPGLSEKTRNSLLATGAIKLKEQ